MILNTVVQETNSPLLGMSLAREGDEEQIFNKYTTLYDDLVTAVLRERTEEKALRTPVTCAEAHTRLPHSTGTHGTQPCTEFDWLRRGSPSLQEEVSLTGRARISGQAPEGNFQNIPEEAGPLS